MKFLKIFTGRLILIRLIMLAAVFLLIGIGIISIYASGNPAGGGATRFSGAWQKQLVYAVAGLIALIIVNLVDYRWLGPVSYWIYAAILIVLAILLIDKVISIPFVAKIPPSYARRWIRLLPKAAGIDLKIQPSEFCKIAYILALAWYLRFRRNYRHFTGLIGPFALTLLAMVLILFEPDLGTVLLMMPILFVMLYVAGARVKHLLIIVLLAMTVSPLLWHRIEPYQRKRISCVLLQNDAIRARLIKNPALSHILTGESQFDERSWQRSSGWQLKHSKFAIASGGLTGYGFAQGPYIKYNSLPERHNDFIFAIIAHQWGFLGCLLVLLLYAVIIACGIEIAYLNTDPFARLVSVGIVTMFVVEIFVNISMTVGLMPITGLTLPLLSYGGSSLMVNIIAIGLLNNIGRQRPFTVAGRAFESRLGPSI